MGLKVTNLSKKYGAVVALSNASFSVEKGEVRAILGGNGSGKSTLAKILGGIVEKNTGEITINENIYNVGSPAQAKKEGVIITSQELSLSNNLTVEENIEICTVPTRWIFVDKKKINTLSVQILDKMGLAHLAKEKVGDLSPDQQYMVELAKAIVQNPDILIIDEITSALYASQVDIVDKLVKDLKNQGKIVLFISHRMNELYAICDSITIMRNGETIETLGINDKSESELLSIMTNSDISADKIQSAHIETHTMEEVLQIPPMVIPGFINNISLKFYKGEIVGIAGLQGHGQSDLLKTIYGMNGHRKIILNNKMIDIHNPTSAVKNGFSFISGDREKYGVFNERNLDENLSVVNELVKNNGKVNPDQVLGTFNVKYNSSQDVITSLSGGNQQKIVVARWLISRPIVLLADDPTKGIDVNARHDLHMQFVDLARQGSLILYVSSDDDELIKLTSMIEESRVVVMYEGAVSAILSGEEITRENISKAAMSI